MTNTAPISGFTPDVTPAQPAPAPAPVQTPATSQTPQPSAPPITQSDTRLVIEDDKAAGSYVYMTVDPVTGKVISQIPREELLKMREAPDYQPGSIVNSRS